jgi:hypothetical protein
MCWLRVQSPDVADLLCRVHVRHVDLMIHRQEVRLRAMERLELLVGGPADGARPEHARSRRGPTRIGSVGTPP